MTNQNRVLLIMTDFYDYYKDIIKEMENCNYEVDWILDRIDLSIFDRIKLKLNPKLLGKLIDKTFMSKIKPYSNKKYNKVVLIFGGKYIKKPQVQYLKDNFKSAEFVYYSWDSIRFFKDILEYIPLFDRVYSFDKADCKKYNMIFLPLFYTNASNELDKVDKIYDFSSVLSFYKEKAIDYKRIINSLPTGLRSFQFLYMRDFPSFIFNKIVYRKEFSGYRKKDFAFKTLTREQVTTVINQSKVIIDCPLHGQNGLTIRTYDVLKSNVKLITTNENIASYDFYCKDNIFILKRNVDSVPISFFLTDFNKKFCLSSKYSISSFVKVLLEGIKIEY